KTRQNGAIHGDIGKRPDPATISPEMSGKKGGKMEISRDISKRGTLLASVHGDILKRPAQIPRNLEISSSDQAKWRHPRGYRKKGKPKSAVFLENTLIYSGLHQF